MKKIFLIATAVLSLTIAYSQTAFPTVQEQLENLNKYWQDKNIDDQILKERILLKNDVQLIQTHLSFIG